MEFSEKLQFLRKSRGFTQEDIAERLGVARQSVAKWEAGQSYPDIPNLIALSELLHVTVDHLIKSEDCSVSLTGGGTDVDELIAFRLEANRCTYAGFANGTESTRGDSCDYHYENGRYAYHDTYVGGEQFAGQEAVWRDGRAVYAMNYCGRVLDERFSGNFLKEALRAAAPDMPYRGPRSYSAGSYTYAASVTGDVSWFQGYEEIFCDGDRVYECFFHGGMMK